MKKIVDFSLEGSDSVFYTNENIGKNYILYLYPKDLTSGCTMEARDFSQKKAEFEKIGFKIFGLSKDEIEKHNKFIQKECLSITLLTDNEKSNLVEKLGSWKEKSMFGKKYMGIERSTFVVVNGEIIKEWRNVKIPGHIDEVFNFCKNIKN